jgi:hypothetical protein
VVSDFWVDHGEYFLLLICELSSSGSFHIALEVQERKKKEEHIASKVEVAIKSPP